MLVATTIVVVAFTPMVTTRTALFGGSDLFAVVFLLLLGSVSLALAALDTGTAFGGMGSSRVMTIVAFAEPALLVAILALAAPVHSSSLPVIVAGSLHHPMWLATPQRLLAFVAFVIVILAESGRLPVDNPATHLELTMIHEAMVLEYSGPDLAFVVLGESAAAHGAARPVVQPLLPLGHRHGAHGRLVRGGDRRPCGQGRRPGRRRRGREVAVAKLRLFRVPELLAGAFVLSVLGRRRARW